MCQELFKVYGDVPVNRRQKPKLTELIFYRKIGTSGIQTNKQKATVLFQIELSAKKYISLGQCAKECPG